MYDEFCLGCGVKLPPNSEECPVCGFQNSPDQTNDLPDNQEFLDDVINDGIPEIDSY